MKHLKKLLAVTGIALLGSGISVSCTNKSEETQGGKPAHEAPFQQVSYTQGGQVDLTKAAEMSVNAVVHVMTKYKAPQRSSSMEMDPFFEFFFRDRQGMQPQQPQPRVGSGSGVILSSDGYIVTNNHVIEDADEITVTLNDKRTFNATLAGTDPSTDLALLKIEATGLPTLEIGSSDDLKVGEWVLAVGNPFNLTSTVTAGIVSAKARNINILSSDMRIESFIQTDAAVNPGNSGGALVNTRGQLVGINTAIASQTGSYAGYAFAVPVSIMSKVVADLKQHGIVQRALLGVIINDINAEFAKEKNIDVLEGAYVAGVNENSGAAGAGIKEGDIITHVNGIRVRSVSELQEQIGRFRPGDKVKIQLIRDGKSKDVEVTLKNTMGNTDIVKEAGLKDLGASFTPVSNRQKQQYGISSGLLVEKVESGGKFAQAGISKGYIILRVNNRSVNSVADIEQIIKDVRQNKGNMQNEQALFISGLNKEGKVTYYAVDLN
jgi:Do/DeqQ family serine protease